MHFNSTAVPSLPRSFPSEALLCVLFLLVNCLSFASCRFVWYFRFFTFLSKIQHTNMHTGFLRYWLHSHFHFHISFSISCIFSSVSTCKAKSNKCVQKMQCYCILHWHCCANALAYAADISSAPRSHILLLFFLFLSFYIFAHQVENSISYGCYFVFRVSACVCNTLCIHAFLRSLALFAKALFSRMNIRTHRHQHRIQCCGIFI